MKKQIKYYRVVLNILFYILYVIIITLLFSFIFPLILILLWKDVIDPINPIFDIIQLSILVVVLIFTLTYRKYFYLPIMSEKIMDDKKIDVNTIKKVFSDINKEEKIERWIKFEEIKSEEKNKNDYVTVNLPELDIKIGKEIK